MTFMDDNVGKGLRSIVLMGTAGSGKTTVGQLLARELKDEFVDADDHHPAANVAKMKRGQALDDEDRKPWLELLRKLLHDTSRKNGVVLACSALKDEYRSVLSSGQNEILFFLLDVPKDELKRRLKSRAGHFFSAELLATQLDILETPDARSVIDGSLQPEEICREISRRLAQ